MATTKRARDPDLGPPVPELIPTRPSLAKLWDAASRCRACHLYRDATQTVFGEGAARASLVLVGEQPGDVEDQKGHVFVGPAGRVLDEALADAGIDRNDVYITNVVKHFKFIRKGKRRIHKKPNTEEVRACLPWLQAEVGLLRPRVVACLGATAAQALLGPKTTVRDTRGRFLETDLPADWITVTVHPSSILRAPDDGTRRAERAAFVRDLRAVARKLREPERAKRRVG
jgi:uracil-DNA glycosylase family protein